MKGTPQIKEMIAAHIRLALPEGREVNVERTPQDERHSDLAFATVMLSSMRANSCMRRFGACEAIELPSQITPSIGVNDWAPILSPPFCSALLGFHYSLWT